MFSTRPKALSRPLTVPHRTAKVAEQLADDDRRDGHGQSVHSTHDPVNGKSMSKVKACR